MPDKNLQSLIKEARRIERYENKSCYVQWTIDGYQLVYRMPILGEWYTSDGIQHGEKHK